VDIAQKKLHLRQQMLERRNAIVASKRSKAAQEIAQLAHVLADLAQKPIMFSSYRALGSEINPLHLERELPGYGAGIALPVIERKAAPLQFKIWRNGDPLVRRTWGILEPQEDAPIVLPDVVLLPLLAFDGAGRRLGYGGGFYDRTLQKLRSLKTIVAIGLAYTEQEVNALPHDSYDQLLDGALLPDGLRLFTQNRKLECDFSF